MEVPEKIYVHKSQYWGLMANKCITTEDDIEYTRTDAFIEKVFEFFEEHLCEYINVKNANCDTFININGDKLKEDFKKYMKGE